MSTKVTSVDINKKNKLNNLEIVMKIIFKFCALISIICVFAITLFILLKGGPAILKIGVLNFLLGQKWLPESYFGIFPMIIGSIYSTAGAIVLGVPIGIFTAVFLTDLAPKRLSNIIHPAIQLLAGIPSVVYGFFGLVFMVPIINKLFGGKGAGSSLLAACIILGIMILPTIITTAETSLKAVPKSYKEGALALGATDMNAIFKVKLIAAKSGILSGVVLGIGRAIGETMAVTLVAGNATIIPKAITDPVRTLTANIALEMGYASQVHQAALFGTGVVLFIFIMLLNIILSRLTNKGGVK
jgi:phosphate transport system permease protein